LFLLSAVVGGWLLVAGGWGLVAADFGLSLGTGIELPVSKAVRSIAAFWQALKCF
jgi:hypothetical protein